MFNKEEFKHKKCLIIGAGKSGVAVAKLLEKTLGCDIYISDISRKKIGFKLILEDEVKEDLIRDLDFAIKSPGVVPTHRIIKLLKSHKKPIFSEIEVGLSFSETKNIVMITGTNGKSTTSYLTYLIFNEFLKKHGKKAILCGNIGYPVSEKVLQARDGDWLIIEVSSYQLEDSTFIKPKIGIITNITPDHLQHHKTMKNYIKAKLKILSFMDEESTLIVNGDDKILKKIKSNRFNILRFSLKNHKEDAYYNNKNIIIKPDIVIKPSDIPGNHNIENQMAAILAGKAAKIDFDTIRRVISSFKGLEHRIEFVREVNGVKYYNDSKATNVDSTLTALRSLGIKKNIHLILGGLHKGTPYTPLVPLVKKYVKTILTIGSSAGIIEKELGKYVKIVNSKTLKNAINYAYKNSKRGEIVLLSPACASFDQFKNFEERGRVFKRYVDNL